MRQKPILQFQFHKGTIKTGQGFDGWQYLNSFQFHKGTIKTSSQQKILLVSLLNFNSIKVRLKLHCFNTLQHSNAISIP